MGVAVAAFLAAVAAIFSWNNSFYHDMASYFADAPSSSKNGRVAVNGRGILGVDFGNGQRRAFAGDIYTGMTILAALRAAENVGSFQVKTDDRGAVVEIAGVKNNGRKRWRMYVNGDPLSELPGNLEIRDGDKVMFKYE